MFHGCGVVAGGGRGSGSGGGGLETQVEFHPNGRTPTQVMVCSGSTHCR